MRGGFGIFYDSYEGREIDDSADIYPYSVRNNLVTTTNATAPKLSNNMFPSYGTLTPFPASTLTFIAVIESENPLDPYVQSWTLSAERELANATTVELNYVGTKSTHLLDRHNIAQPYQVPAASVPFCDATRACANSWVSVDSKVPFARSIAAGCSISSAGRSRMRPMRWRMLIEMFL